MIQDCLERGMRMTIVFDGNQVAQYAALQMTGTDFLGFRDLEAFARLHQVNNARVLDLGCGAGRSTQLSFFA